MPFERGGSSERINFEGKLSVADVAKLAAAKRLAVIHASAPVEESTWDLLNEKLFVKRPKVELYVDMFYPKPCNFAFLSRMGNVRRFRADVRGAKGVNHIADLKGLESLALYSLESMDFLAGLDGQKLRTLELASYKPGPFSLAPLENYKKLQLLYLENLQKDIEAASGLQQLESLTLRSITLGSLGFLSKLKKLWWLDIKLGGTTNLSGLKGMKSLKYLELWQIKGLKDLSVISTLVGLQYLFLQSLTNVTSLPNLSKLKSLRRIHLENLVNLKDISSLQKAPSLEELVHALAKRFEPEQYFQLLKSKRLKRMRVGFGSLKKNKLLEERAKEEGIEELEDEEFKFR